MKLNGLNACSFIVLMLIAWLAIAVPADRATACTGYYWDNNAKQMVCIDASQSASSPTTKASSSAPESCMWSWDPNLKQMVCVDLSQLASTPTATTAPTSTTKTTAQTSQASEPCWSEYLQYMLGYCPPTGIGPSVNTGIYYGSTSSSTATTQGGACPYGGTYYAVKCTKLCGCQYNICVTYDWNCGTDYHP